MIIKKKKKKKNGEEKVPHQESNRGRQHGSPVAYPAAVWFHFDKSIVGFFWEI